MLAQGGAGPPLISVGVRAVFSFELVGGARGDLFGVDVTVDGGGVVAGGRAVTAMVASSAQAIFRSGLPLSSSRSRWSPSRTYQPPSGSLAHSPVRLDGPRENSGTGVASRPAEPSDAARSSSVRTETLASSSALISASSRSRAASACAGVICLVRALRSCPVRRRFFGSGEGSTTSRIAWKQYRTRR